MRDNIVLIKAEAEKEDILFFLEKAGVWEQFGNTRRLICPNCKEILEQCGDIPHTCSNLFCKKNGDGKLSAVCMCCGLPGPAEEEETF